MNKRRWSPRLFLRYSLIQVPELGVLLMVLVFLNQLIHVPAWILWTIISLWIIVNVIMFPFVYRAYEKNVPVAIPGSKGIAVDRLSPSGYVRLNGELWRAQVIEDDSAIEKGEDIVVAGRKGLTLTVLSDKENERS
jgi:membrane protein implicated in regulation of membrane protease activity